MLSSCDLVAILFILNSPELLLPQGPEGSWHLRARDKKRLENAEEARDDLPVTKSLSPRLIHMLRYSSVQYAGPGAIDSVQSFSRVLS